DWDQTKARFHVVLGNEACDVDSMVCSLVYAYFLSKTVRSETLAVPLLNIRQSELVLRSDNVALLRLIRLPPDLLLFRDQLDLLALHRAGRLWLTLVDHNLLPSSDHSLEEAVVEVIDHHLLEREPRRPAPSPWRRWAPAPPWSQNASCRKLRRSWDQQAAQLLYAAVVLDCVNIGPLAGKVTPKDSRLAAALERRFPALPPRGALFQTLNQAKFDVSGLSTEQMLLKDRKSVSGSLNLAVSVLYVALEVRVCSTLLCTPGVSVTARVCVSGLPAEAGLGGRPLRLLCQVRRGPAAAHDRFLHREPGANQRAGCVQPQHGLQGGGTAGPLVLRLAERRYHDNRPLSQASQYLEEAQNQTLRLCPISSLHPHLTAYRQGNL
ncbi:unnamed protein product, partial [Tetraodon nigroviridis]